MAAQRKILANACLTKNRQRISPQRSLSDAIYELASPADAIDSAIDSTLDSTLDSATSVFHTASRRAAIHPAL